MREAACSVYIMSDGKDMAVHMMHGSLNQMTPVILRLYESSGGSEDERRETNLHRPPRNDVSSLDGGV
jgi:hypothetical protein